MEVYDIFSLFMVCVLVHVSEHILFGIMLSAERLSSSVGGSFGRVVNP